jgi:hypothetical protein
MTPKITYLRDRSTARVDKVGTRHRAEPVAVVVSDVNRENRMIRYAVAMVHPSETFRKEFARHIALERLNGLGKNDKPKAQRLGRSAKSCSGARMVVREELSGGSLTSPGTVRLPLPESGHELTCLVMRDIFASVDLPDRLRNLACDWLEYDAAMTATEEDNADRLPTIPVPPTVVSSSSLRMTETPLERVSDNPEAMRQVALSTIDRRHRDVIPPPPMKRPAVGYTRLPPPSTFPARIRKSEIQ